MTYPHHKRTADPDKVARTLALVREGLDAGTIAQRVGGSPKTVRKYAAEAGLTVAVRRVTAIDGAIIESCATRNTAGVTIVELAREHGIPESTLTSHVRRVQTNRRRIAHKERQHKPKSELAQAASMRELKRRAAIASSEVEAAVGAPVPWVGDVKPRGRRIVLELVDDGVGSIVLVARVEPLHAAHQPCRRCADEDQRPVLAQESFDPASPYWAARALSMLGGGQ